MSPSDTNTKKRQVVFIGANDLLVPVINSIADTYDVTVCESGIFKRVLEPKINVSRLRKSFFNIEKIFKTNAPLPYYFVSLQALLNHKKPDIIIVMDWIRFWYWQVLLYKLKHPLTKIIVYSETQKQPRNVFKRIFFRIFLWVYKRTEKYVSSYWVYTLLGKSFTEKHTITTKVELMAVPVDTNHFSQKSYDGSHTRSSGLKVLMNARYESYKRHVDLIEAVRELRTRGHDCYVTFISRDTVGIEPIEDLVRSYDLDPLVTFKESVTFDELPALYHEHDVLVLPSDNEPIGMVVPEAMACGLPTITSDSVGANVYVKEGVTGLLFPTGNTKVLAEKLEYFCNTEYTKEMGKAARTHIEIFSIPAQAEVFMNALDLVKGD